MPRDAAFEELFGNADEFPFTDIVPIQKDSEPGEPGEPIPDEQPTKIPAPEPGLHFDIPFGQYLSWDAVNQSACKPMDITPAHYVAYLTKNENTPALRVGSLTDTLVFEPKLFAERFDVTPRSYVNSDGDTKPWRGNANVCKEWVAESAVSGKTILTPKEHDEAVRLSQAVFKHRAGGELLAKGQAQISMVWVDEVTGVLCKGRLDWLTDEAIVDLKTTIDASEDGFPSQINKYRYHVQAAFYKDGYKAITGLDRPFIIIAAEKGSPWGVHVVEVQPPSLETGRSMYRRALSKFRECQDTNNWHGYSQFVEPIDIPLWAIRQELGKEYGEADVI